MRPLEGIRVLEVAMYGFVPSAGAVLGEWGADVIKVEHAVTGDPQRGLRQTGPLRVEGEPNPDIYNGQVMPGMGTELRKAQARVERRCVARCRYFGGSKLGMVICGISIWGISILTLLGSIFGALPL